MNNFQFYNPVKVVFGKGSVEKLARLIPDNHTVVLVYGGGSIQRNGVYDDVLKALAGFEVTEFGGVEPNPKYETLMRCVTQVRATANPFLLAVGGGSVIDGTKFIAAAAPFEGGEPWEILAAQAPIHSALPMGALLTLPATGSEMNNGAVVSRLQTKEKLVFQNDLVYPQFAVMDPVYTFSLPPDQTANGIVDAWVHVLEQYTTFDVNTPLQDRQAEAVLATLLLEGPKVLAEPDGYEARANIMWSATNALNRLLSCGIVSDWATHLIGHEISALTELAHARTLACVLPSLLRHQIEHKEHKLARYGEQVFGVPQSDERTTALSAITKTETFFNSLGVETRLSAHMEQAQFEVLLREIPARFEARRMILGERRDITPAVVERILRDAW